MKITGENLTKSDLSILTLVSNKPGTDILRNSLSENGKIVLDAVEGRKVPYEVSEDIINIFKRCNIDPSKSSIRKKKEERIAKRYLFKELIKHKKCPDVLSGIKDYLISGGSFNPELADHDSVRDLILSARDEIEKLEKAAIELDKYRDFCIRLYNVNYVTYSTENLNKLLLELKEMFREDE